ncbi:predicted protein [Candida tropicalis MYA-3404]|uniref:Nucleoporin Nup159/Nup146 N-terminal domain-containing protein n=1 Tax=Candida tropicalis (strain ATCC MYA-3404 / T1) TaxID=294747 RepID=C5MHN3_CANTT|nr:predicted protein [Candida tropicalis MYA-3404]EER30580.1 predicted protein [Candida tropicalis MYA-3404]KAG4409351.1 hypothetical protein JTP64_002657 [Candida tropicalis]
MSVEETISEDLGFKLNTQEHGVSVFDPLDLESLGGKSLKLLAVHDDLIVASNGKSLKVLLPNNLENSTTIGDDFNITQLHFVGNDLYVLDDVNIKKLSVDQLRNKDYSFQTLQSGYIDIAPSSSGILALDSSYELYLDSKKVATNVSAFCWTKSSYVYAIKDRPLEIKNKKIDLEGMSGFYIADMFAVSEKYLFVAYDRVDAELDDHEVTTYLLEEHDDKYTAIDIDIAPAFSSTARSMTNYHATLSHWHENENLSLITSSLATDIGILETETLQIYGQSEDINRAQFPLDEETGDDCSPVGFALSLHEFSSKVVEPCPGVDDVTGKLPRLYVLLHTGSLVSWWIFHKAGILNDTLSLQKAVEYSIPKEMEQPLGESLAAEVKQEEPKKVDNPFGSTAASAFGGFSTPKTANTSIAKSDSQTSQGPTSFGKTSAFGSSGFGSTGFGSSDSSKQRGTSAFGNTGFGSTSFGSSGFGSSGFGQTSSAAPSGFGQSGFGKSTMSASSGFAKFANSKNSIFGPNEKAESPFGDTQKKEASPFGKATESPFGKATESPFGKATESPFGKTTESPFGKATESPFGKTTESPFGKTTESPFGDTQKKEASPFGKATESPFGKATESPFGKAVDLPFGKLNKSTVPPLKEITKKEESPFRGFGMKEEPTERKTEKEASRETKKENTSVEFSATNVLAGSPFSERAKSSLDDSPFKELVKSEVEDEEEVETDENAFESDVESEDVSLEQSDSIEDLNRFEDVTIHESELESLSDQAQSTKKEIEEIKDVTQKVKEVKLESKPAEFLTFAGFTKPIVNSSSNEIVKETIKIIANTEGNLQIAAENGNLLNSYIDGQQDNFVPVDSLELAQTRVPLVERTHELELQLSQLNKLGSNIQQSYTEKTKIDKLYSQLALIAENKVENTPVLKSRPLDVKDDCMRTQLRKKLAQIKSDEQKLLTMLMPLKAKNSMNSHTIDNIERIVFQINEQILDRTEAVDNLVSQLDKLEIEPKKEITVSSNSSKLKLRRKLKQTKTIMY